jgi:colanic acid/amylovoran biosynthesis glycosyltransferase
MKVILVTSSAPYGKGESFVIAEANALADAGASVSLVPVIIRQGEQNKQSLRPNIEVLVQRLLSIEILTAGLRLLILRPATTLHALWSLRSMNLLNLLKNIAVFPKALWLAGLVKSKSIEHIHAHWASTSSTVAMVASMLSSVPWSCTAHRGDIVAHNLLCKKISHAMFIRFISDSGISLARKRCLNTDAKARLLHMGVDIPESPSAEIGREKFVVLCPANMISVKGHRYLIEAWSMLQPVQSARLLLAGDGELRKELEAQITRLGLEKTVELLGHVPHATLLAMYERGDVNLVVLPSLDLGGGVHEGIPVSLMEAMAYSVPVISTTTGGIPELLDGGAGVMVPHMDSANLATAIQELLNDRDAAYRQGVKGRVRVMQQFDNKAIADTMLTWFSEPQA